MNHLGSELEDINTAQGEICIRPHCGDFPSDYNTREREGERLNATKIIEQLFLCDQNHVDTMTDTNISRG